MTRGLRPEAATLEIALAISPVCRVGGGESPSYPIRPLPPTTRCPTPNHPTRPTRPGLDQSMVHASMITQLEK